MIKSAVLLVSAFLALSAHAAVDKYKLDPVHTTVLFKVNHLGFSNSYGLFTGVEGSFSIDEAKPETASIDLKIKTDSLTTLNAKRDQHLKSPDFFNVKANPWITFKSNSVKKIGEIYKIEGDLSLNGVTKPVTLDFKRQRTGKGMQGEIRTGGDTTLKLKRSDYNMKYMNAADQIGNEVEVIISVEAIRE